MFEKMPPLCLLWRGEAVAAQSGAVRLLLFIGEGKCSVPAPTPRHDPLRPVSSRK